MKYTDIVKNFIKYSFCPLKENSETQVIFKFDDLSDFGRKVKRADILVKLLKIKVLWGIIGKSLENPDKKYLEFLRNRNTMKYYRFFNHGYYHLMGEEYEFTGKTKEEQKEYIEKTQRIVYENTGILPDTFAAPCNHTDENTVNALNEFPEIKYVLFGSEKFCGRNFSRTINMENGAGNIDFEFFRWQWECRDKRNKIITLQGHPYAWNVEKSLQFALIVLFLRKHGCRFVFPEEAV